MFLNSGLPQFLAEPDLMANDPTRVLLRQMMGAVAQYDKSMIVVKLRAARQRKKARTGRCESAKPYGYYPGEKAVIERMSALRAQGWASTVSLRNSTRMTSSRAGGNSGGA